MSGKKQTLTNKKKRERYKAKHPRGSKRGGRESIERFKIKRKLYQKITPKK